MEDPAAPGAGSPPTNGNGNGSGKGKPAAPKGREAFRSQRRESEGSVDCPTLEFEYGDADGHAAELSELYSYTENPEFTTNRRCFEEDFKTQVQGEEWLELEEDAQKAYVMGLLDRLEVVSRERRLKVARAVLYLAQGTFGECDSEVDVLHWSRYNCFLLYQMGTFSAFLELLHMEIDNSQACSSALRKPAISIADSTELRVLLSVLYLMVENIRLERETDSCGWRTARETFRTELSFSTHNQEPFALLLFSMVTKFCSGLAPHFPIKKVLLLLWKVVMFTLGGFEHLQALKVQKRAELGLPPLAEDSIQVVKSMRAASPPSYTLDLGESQLAPPPSKLRGRRGSRRQLLTKQDSLDIYNERDLFKTEEPATEEEEESASDGERTLDGELDLLEQDPLVPPPPSQAPLSAERVAFPKGLPWAPKVRQKDIEHFLEMSRNKFIGFTLGQDTDTLVGLPRPIHESVKTLKQHKYVSIADVQIKNEEELEKCPMSLYNLDFSGSPVVKTPCFHCRGHSSQSTRVLTTALPGNSQEFLLKAMELAEIALAKGDSGLSSLLSTRGPCLPTLIKDLNGVITRTKLCIRGWSKSRASSISPPWLQSLPELSDVLQWGQLLNTLSCLQSLSRPRLTLCPPGPAAQRKNTRALESSRASLSLFFVMQNPDTCCISLGHEVGNFPRKLQTSVSFERYPGLSAGRPCRVCVHGRFSCTAWRYVHFSAVRDILYSVLGYPEDTHSYQCLQSSSRAGRNREE
ncbi:hypothetical protein FD755_012932 [Muntiacus reevesi]|uniref:Far11/STRP N-terminal domain-containing protein n=1 Tax=Muntiacus reevesi TaxID=9886 RepID=A0A5N3XR39_MUNRE|nr:hypothetical protein FD755_012932 [Muntiacus reevesi]